MKLMRLLQTVRHLRGRQMVGQARLRARRAWENPAKILDREVPPYPGCLWNPRAEFLPAGGNRHDAAQLRSGCFTFLNQPKELGWPPEWQRAGLGKLWCYNLHYFEYLWSLDHDDAVALALNWTDRHQPGRGQAGWESYPTSLRLMNWCGVFFARRREAIEGDMVARDKLWTSIYRQSEWLSGHLETHLLGNHLLENAAALAMVGCCFAGDAARRWYRRGCHLLQEQVAEQMLPDGGHFERSPMYHSRVVYALAMLRNLGCDALDRLVDRPLVRAVDALKLMCHPDGQIALLNDSAFGIYNEPSALCDYAGSPASDTVGNFALPDTGYYGVRTADGSYLICDAGPIGPDYLPGHAHGDMLSFELSLRGQRVIVDSGVYDYVPGPMRQYCRSTRAHNTVEIDGSDQCEFWGAFRVARRGHVRDVRWAPLADGFELAAEHDGYARLRGWPIHRRRFRWHNPGRLLIRDQITGSSAHSFVSRLHLHPDCTIVKTTANRVVVGYSGGSFAVQFSGEGHLSVEDSIYCPQFERKVSNQAIAWSGQMSGSADFMVGIGDGEAGTLRGDTE